MNILDKDYKMKVTPEQSRAVQEACFAHGMEWNGGDPKTVAHTDKPYLYIRAWGKLHLEVRAKRLSSTTQISVPSNPNHLS